MNFFLLYQKKHVNLPTSGRQMGLLKALGYLAAIVVVVGSVVRGWNFNLLVALILVGATYPVVLDMRALNRLATRNEQTQSSDTMIPLQRSSRGEWSQHPTQRLSRQQGVAGKTQDSAGWVQAPQHTMQKGTTHEGIG